MKNVLALSLVAALSGVLLIACGPKTPGFDKNKSDKQIAASKSLIDFMKQNPEIANASLEEIRGKGKAGAGSKSSGNKDAKLSVEEFTNASFSIDSAKAAEANRLLDEAFLLADMEALFGAGMKLAAVSLNFQKEAMAAANTPKANPDFETAQGTHDKNWKENQEKDSTKKVKTPAKEKNPGRSEKERGQPTCKEVMDDPYAILAKMSGESSEEVEKTIKGLNELFKKQVSQCRYMPGGKFAECNADLSQFTADAQKLTCSINSFSEFEKIMGKAYQQMEKAHKICLEAFAACGFGMGGEAKTKTSAAPPKSFGNQEKNFEKDKQQNNFGDTQQ